MNFLVYEKHVYGKKCLKLILTIVWLNKIVGDTGWWVGGLVPLLKHARLFYVVLLEVFLLS